MIIELPDGTELEAPDGLAPAQIKSIVQKHTRAPAVAPRASESAARGGLQGLTFGFGDEAAGAIAAAMPFLDREAAKGDTFGDRYKNARDFYRGKNAQAQQANPVTYTAGEVAGAVAPTLVGGLPLTGAKGVAVAAGQGALQGAGYSDAKDAASLGSDTALGGAIGTAGYGAGKVLGKALGALRSAADRGAGLARSRAGALATGEVTEKIGSARGELGAEVQKGSRYVENLMRLEASMTPEQRALYAQLETSGIVPNLQQSVAQSTLERLPAQAGTIAEKQAALQALTQSAPDLAAERTQQLLTPQIGADARSFFKSYGEPLAWMYGANKIGEGMGLDPSERAALVAGAGVVGGRTRAGKALWNRINRPAHQLALAEALKKNTDGRRAMVLRRALAAGVPAAVIDGEVDE